MTHNELMDIALELALRGQGYTSPNPMVGAIVVKDGEIVGKGWHRVYGKAHAEVNAIDDAGELAKDADLYVTLEPCNHHGKTPPCTEKILASGIRRVFVAMKDPNPDVKGGGNDYLRSQGIQVISGISETGAEKLNEAFIKYTLSKRPFVILKCAATLDGRIATRTGDSKWVSGELSRKFVHRLRHATDAIMVGIGTIGSDNPMLTTRLEDQAGKDPIRIILDTHLTISEDATVLNLDSQAKTIVVCGPDISPDKKRIIEQKGAMVMLMPLDNGRVSLDALMLKLGEMRITSLLIEGGAQVIASALNAGIVDKVMFCYAPKILGGDDGVPICRGKGAELMSDCIRLRDIEVRRFEDDVMIVGYTGTAF
jgi:diaminohydroxyphosphoribosylaminopyrimidine deaminase/5-amino-6-(5-phosphoribosylamino)uracil reductase